MAPDADRILGDYLEAHPECLSEWRRDHKLKHDPRVTRLGSLLRRRVWTSCRSFGTCSRRNEPGGPRPIVCDEVAKYGDGFLLYTQVLPGITGCGRSRPKRYQLRRRVALDSYYVRNWSPWFDIYLLGRTVRT